MEKEGKKNVRLTGTTNNSPGDTTKTPTETKDSICPCFIAWIRNGRYTPTSNANCPGEDALHHTDGDGLLQRGRSAKQSTGHRASEEGDKEDETLTVFLSDGGPEEGSHELGEEECGNQETCGKANVGPLRKFVKAFNHKK